MTVFGIINILVAIILGSCSFFDVRIGDDPMNFTGLAFTSGALALIPFVSSYTRLGFNEDAESGHEEESKRRKKIISSQYPGIMRPFYMGFALIPLSWIFHAYVNPFTFFIAVVNTIAAYWCLYVLPKARKLFSPFR